MTVFHPILPEVAGSADFGDKINGAAMVIRGPDFVESDDVAVAERPEKADLREESVEHLLIATETAEPDLVPGHLDAILLVEGSVDSFNSSGTKEVAVAAVAAGGVYLYERFRVAIHFSARPHARHRKESVNARKPGT